jgi:hypothetical protein
MHGNRAFADATFLLSDCNDFRGQFSLLFLVVGILQDDIYISMKLSFTNYALAIRAIGLCASTKEGRRMAAMVRGEIAGVDDEWWSKLHAGPRLGSAFEMLC